MAPITFSVQVPQRKFCFKSKLDPGGIIGDLARNKFMPAPRRLAVIKNSAGGMKILRFPIIASKFEACHFGYSIRRSRVKSWEFILGNFVSSSKHLAGTRKIKLSILRQLMQRSKHVVRSIDVLV
jgi:hypothetical protein